MTRAGRRWQVLAEHELTIDPATGVDGVAAVDGALLARTGTKLICIGPPQRL